MKIVILAGGKGTRIAEETEIIPKPMVEIGGKPILWHIMKFYSSYGFNDFIICLGYNGYLVKEYFSHYFLHMSDVTIDMKLNKTTIHNTTSDPWKITLVDTGLDTMTGGRIKRIKPYVGNKTFMLTYGDGLADVDIKKLLDAHKKNRKLATLTTVQTSIRFGVLDIIGSGTVKSFKEKPRGEGGWINAGYFVLEPGIFKYIKDDSSIWEREPLSGLVHNGQLNAYKHKGFWKCMDTLRDKLDLEQIWKTGKAPWKIRY